MWMNKANSQPDGKRTNSNFGVNRRQVPGLPVIAWMIFW